MKSIMIYAFAFLCLSVYSRVIPEKCAHHELVYDEVNKVVLMTAGSTPLNAGQSEKFFNDLWKCDGSLGSGGKCR